MFFVFDSCPLLGCALHALGTRVHVIVVIVHRSAARPCLFSGRIDVLKRVILDHGICGRRCVLDLARTEDALERSLVVVGKSIFATDLLGELDIELDVEVAKVVMSVRRHTLTADDLDGTCCNVSCANGSIKTWIFTYQVQ